MITDRHDQRQHTAIRPTDEGVKETGARVAKSIDAINGTIEAVR